LKKKIEEKRKELNQLIEEYNRIINPQTQEKRNKKGKNKKKKIY
jgi:hypothetical protein